VPDWARPAPMTGHSLLTPARYPDFARFGAAVGTRYRGKVAAYVIWNEPNVDYEWGYRKPDPAGYAQLLRAAYPALKKADADALVLAAALAPNGEHTDHALSDLDYLQQLYASGGAPLFDGLAAHAYGWDHPPDESPAPDRIDFRRVELERQIMVRNGDAAKQVYVTESGWNDYARWVRAVSPEQRVDYTVQSVELASRWDWLAAICLWEFRLPAPAHNYNDAWTLVHFDFTPSPTYVALQRLASPTPPAGWMPFIEQPASPAVWERAANSAAGLVADLARWAGAQRYAWQCRLAGCTVPPDLSLRQVQDAGVLRVVMDASFPPLESVGSDGQLAGLDVNVARAVAAALGVELQLTNMSSDGLKDAVFSGKADAVVSSFQPIPEWRKELSYSTSYYADAIPVTYGLDSLGEVSIRVDDVPYVIAVRAGRDKLLDAINSALARLMDTGELQALTGQTYWR
ncbi:MAG TPA: transporter substrate-binding domain-containing protein, partial [Chloroflexota bacterium]